MKKKVLILIVGLLSALLVLNYLFPSGTIYYGWIEINGKNVENDTYYLNSHLEEPIEIAINQSDTFIYEENPQSKKEVSIDEVWHLIEADDEYFVRINTHRFRTSYKLEKLYGY